jgi:TonB family protein
MKSFILILILLQSITCLRAQDKIQVYYDKDWKISLPSEFAFRRDADFDFIELVFNGQYKDYDKENNLIGEGAYSKGAKTGIHNTYFSNGKLESSIEYVGEDFTIKELNSEYETLITRGTGEFSIPFTIYKKEGVLKGEFKNYKKTGKWTYFDSEGKKSHEEIYKDNIFQKGTYFSPRGETPLVKKREIFIKPNEFIETFDINKMELTSLFCFFSTQTNSLRDSLSIGVRYPGGMKNLLDEINRMIRYPVEAFRNGIRGRVIVTITVDKEGQVKKYDITKSVDKSLDSEAVRVLQLFEDKWFPSVLKGQPFESTISIPITFN